MKKHGTTPQALTLRVFFGFAREIVGVQPTKKNSARRFASRTAHPLHRGAESALCPAQLWGSRNSNPSHLFYHFPGGVASAAEEFFTHLSKICARLLEFVENGAYNKEVNDIIIGGSFS